MHFRNKALRALLGGSLLAFANGQPPVEADNTKLNQRDRVAGAVTADQQKMNKPDRETARKIRRAVYQDKALSTYAHNVKIIVQDGTVTLKGPVRSDEEKDSVFKKAAAIAGESKVINQLQIAPSK